MQISELQKRLQKLHDLGFVPSERQGSTGIGHTLEAHLGVPENNLPIPDIGGRTEIKATRRAANNLITLFTFNRSAWKLPQADAVQKWGNYDDKKQRFSFYSTVSAAEPNTQGLQIIVLDGSEEIAVIDAHTREILASWDLFHIVGKFVTKFERLLLVHADAQRGKYGEEFHFNQAQLLSEPSATTFRNSFLARKAFIDIRMHLKSSGAVRNHGTGFRVYEHNLPSLFGRVQNLLCKSEVG